MTEQRKEPSAGFKHAVAAFAGGCAGAGVDTVLFPLDTIKTRLQAKGNAPPLRADFYKGLAVNNMGSFLSSGTFFMCYEASKEKLSAAYPHAWAPLIHMGSAALADIGACSVRVPFEGMKQRMQAGMHKTTMEAVRAVYAAQGLGGFYNGYLSTVIREVPFDMLEFALYEFMKAKYLRYRHPTAFAVPSVKAEPEAPYEEPERRKVPSPTYLESSVLGAIAGGVAAGTTTPLDVIKTRLMTQSAPVDSPERYKGIADCFNRIMKEEGSSAFFRGIGPRVAWISLGGSIFFGVYETVRKNLLLLG